MLQIENGTYRVHVVTAGVHRIRGMDNYQFSATVELAQQTGFRLKVQVSLNDMRFMPTLKSFIIAVTRKPDIGEEEAYNVLNNGPSLQGTALNMIVTHNSVRFEPANK